MSSLRRRAVAGAALTAAAALAVSGIAIHLTVRSVLTGGFDADLAARARALAGLVVVDSGHVEALAPSGSEYGAEGDVVYRIADLDGVVLARSPALSDRDLASGDMGTLESPAIRLDQLHGAAVRAATAMWTVRHDGRASRKEVRAVVTVARRTEALDTQLGRLAWLLSAVTAAVAVACGLAMSAVIRQVLVPLDRLAKRIGALDDRSLGKRLGLGAVPLELVPVVGRLDNLLARLEQAFTREKVFSAAVAHELRTPIAGLRATIDVCQARVREPAEYQRALAECEGICAQMQAMVESLLLLARLDTGQIHARTEELDLADALRACWRAYDEAARTRRLRVDWKLAEPLLMVTDPALLRVVTANLFDNATSHADEGGDIVIATSSADGIATIRVANSGCALAPEQAGKVFDRFWRGDASRGATGRHCGLGLSLCQDLATILGGNITASVQGGRFSIELSVPLRSGGIGGAAGKKTPGQAGPNSAT